MKLISTVATNFINKGLRSKEFKLNKSSTKNAAPIKDDADTNSVASTASNNEVAFEPNVLFRSINDHQSNQLKSFDLVASNSFVSNSVRSVMGSALMNSYCIGTPGARFYGGCSEIDDIEIMTKELTCELFGAKYCELQLLSGMLANIAAYHAMLSDIQAAGETPVVMASPAKNGGHYSHNKGGALTTLFRAKVVTTPWDPATYNVDVTKLDASMAEHHPNLLIIGWSEMLFDHDLPAIRKICDKYGCKILYDMSHVAGLIAGKQFQTDMMEYVDIVTSSTGKSFHSADHGMILYNDPNLTPKIREAVMPILTSNTHFHETAALCMTLLEMKYHGEEYAKQVIANSKALGAELTKRGFTILCEPKGYSETHEVICSLHGLDGIDGPIMTGPEATRKLDRANIRVNPQELPDDTPATGATALRLGTQVLTRRGFKESDMATVAEGMYRALVADTEGLESICYDVAKTAGRFQNVHYSFDESTVTVPPSLFQEETKADEPTYDTGSKGFKLFKGLKM